MLDMNQYFKPKEDTIKTKVVIKRNGTTAPFDIEKTRKWVNYSTRMGIDGETLLKETVDRLPSEVSTDEIHQTMIDVCISKKEKNYSRVAARLEYASLRKTMTNKLGMNDKTHTLEQIYNKLIELGIWDKNVIPEFKSEYATLYESLYDERFEFWQIKQWIEKYGIKYQGECIETPHIGALGIALSIHGDDFEQVKLLTTGIVKGKLNMPTPVINGCRNGDFNTISCCVIRGGDTADSIDVANHIAYNMTHKKAGIGIRHDTRSIGNAVKGGAVTHLGKQPIYAHVDTAVKVLTQVSRGGSATVTFSVYDPEIMDLLLLKTQRIPENKRIDKLDYSMAFDDNFLDQIVKDGDIQTKSLDGTLGDLIKARDILKSFLTARQETGRVYAINLTTTNKHSPFLDEIYQSNLCLHKDTMIEIEGHGEMTIKRFTDNYNSFKNPKVLTWNNQTQTTSFELVSNAGITGTTDEMMELEDENGNIVQCTLNHLIHTENRGWVEAQHLTLDDIIISLGKPDSVLKEEHSGTFSTATTTTNNKVKLRTIKKIKVEKQEVYDITVPANSQFFANKILVHNCQEIALPTKPYKDMLDLEIGKHEILDDNTISTNWESEGETAFCSIGGINVSRILPFEYEAYAECMVRTINILIDKAPMMSRTMKASILKRRSLGIGILGLADWLYKQDLSYSDADKIEELAERHYFYLLKASQKLVEEGKYEPVQGIDQNWLPIDTKHSDKEPTLDWESLRNKPRANSVLVAHMPTETSSQFSNAYNGLYPARSQKIIKDSRTGRVLFIGKPVKEFAWDIGNKVISTMYACVQCYTDQAISADEYVVPNRYPDGKVPMSIKMKEFIYHFKNGNKTLYYQNTLDANGGMFDVEEEKGCSGGGCSL